MFECSCSSVDDSTRTTLQKHPRTQLCTLGLPCHIHLQIMREHPYPCWQYPPHSKTTYPFDRSRRRTKYNSGVNFLLQPKLVHLCSSSRPRMRKLELSFCVCVFECVCVYKQIETTRKRTEYRRFFFVRSIRKVPGYRKDNERKMTMHSCQWSFIFPDIVAHFLVFFPICLLALSRAIQNVLASATFFQNGRGDRSSHFPTLPTLSSECLCSVRLYD